MTDADKQLNGGRRFPPVSAGGSPGNEAAESSDEVLGRQLGPYTLTSVLGEGGYGIVYLAQQERPFKRQVALKLIKPGMDTKHVMARFEAERQALALLDHPNIAHVFDAGTSDDGRPYFAMEYVNGPSITRHCDQEKLSIDDRLSLFCRVCEAIQYAHQKGIIHRDIKPSNILVSVENGAALPKVIDFGIAKALTERLTEQTLYTTDGQFVGTPGYMSPEQADLRHKDIDTRSDVYSLGAVLYVLLTGALPFDSQTFREGGIEQIRRTIREEEPQSPSTRLSRLSDDAPAIAASRQTSVATLIRKLHTELEWIPLKAIQKKREWRYQSVAELGADIDNYLHGRPLRAGPPSKLYAARKFIRRHRFAVLAGASIVALALLAIVVLSLSTIIITQQKRRTQTALTREEQARQEVAQQRDAAYRNLYVAQIRLALPYWEAGQIARMKDLLERHIPKWGEVDLRSWEWYYLVSLCHRDIETLEGHDASITCVAWSPDGRWLASGDSSGTAKIWNAGSGKSIFTLNPHSGAVSIAWSADSQRIATAGGTRWIRVWNAGNGELILTIPTAGRIDRVAWRNDGHYLAGCCDDGTVLVWDAAEGKEVTRLSAVERQYYMMSWSPDGEHIAAGTLSGFLGIFDIATGEEVLTWQAHAHDLWALAWSPDGKYIASGSYDCALRIWDPKTGHQTDSIALGAGIKDCEWSPDAKRIASTTMGQIISVSNPGMGLAPVILRGHTRSVNTVAWSPDGKHLASGGDDCLVKIWDTEDDGQALVLRHPNASAVAWSPDDELLASGGGGKIRIWDPIIEQELRVWDYPEHPTWIAWDPQGGRLAVGRWGGDGKLTAVYDVANGKEITRITGATNPVWKPDGDTLAVAVADSIQVCSPSDPEARATIGRLLSPVYGLS